MPLMVLLVMHQPGLHQPWRLDRCDLFIRSHWMAPPHLLELAVVLVHGGAQGGVPLQDRGHLLRVRLLQLCQPLAQLALLRRVKGVGLYGARAIAQLALLSRVEG